MRYFVLALALTFALSPVEAKTSHPVAHRVKAKKAKPAKARKAKRSAKRVRNTAN